MRHTWGGKAAVASDKAKVNGRRREQAEATRIGEDNRDDDEEENTNNDKNNSNRKQGRLTGYITVNSQNFHMQTDWILLSWVLISKSRATNKIEIFILPPFNPSLFPRPSLPYFGRPCFHRGRCYRPIC